MHKNPENQSKQHKHLFKPQLTVNKIDIFKDIEAYTRQVKRGQFISANISNINLNHLHSEPWKTPA